jgi:hypothetical protein
MLSSRCLGISRYRLIPRDDAAFNKINVCEKRAINADYTWYCADQLWVIWFRFVALNCVFWCRAAEWIRALAAGGKLTLGTGTYQAQQHYVPIVVT